MIGAASFGKILSTVRCQAMVENGGPVPARAALLGTEK
jgi:hypothetical protein